MYANIEGWILKILYENEIICLNWTLSGSATEGSMRSQALAGHILDIKYHMGW